MGYLPEKSYLAVKVEATAGTPLKPAIFIPLLNETIEVNENKSKDTQKIGAEWSGRDLLQGPREFSGDLEILADPKSLGHILDMMLYKDTTTNDGGSPLAYTHPFIVGTPKTYTIEVGVSGLYAKRLFGTMGNKLAFSNEDGRLKATLGVQAMGMWDVRQLKTALTGAGMTQIEFDQEHNTMPNRGLVVGDVITVGGVNITLTSVDAGGQVVGFSSTTVTASVGDAVYLKAQTPSYSGLRKPLLFENLLVGIGADTSAADTAATAANQTKCHEIAIEIENNLLAAPVSGDNYGARTIQPKARSGKLTIKRLFEGVGQMQKFLHNTQQAVTMIFNGLVLNSVPTSEKLTVRLYNVKLMTNKEPLAIGDITFDEQDFEVLYDETKSKAITVDLVNLQSGSDY